jgi:hypothetical protein
MQGKLVWTESDGNVLTFTFKVTRRSSSLCGQ